MNQIATTKMSSKGQIVIPESVRNQLGLMPGAQFLVMAEHDVIILQSIVPPSKAEFSRLIAKTRKAVKKASVKPSGLKNIIKTACQKQTEAVDPVIPNAKTGVAMKQARSGRLSKAHSIQTLRKALHADD